MPSLKLKPWERRSRNEEQFEAELKKRGISYEYEPETMVLMPSCNGTDGKIGSTTYTPDYKLTFPNGKVMWIEVKGFARAADLLKNKLADWYITNKRQQGYMMVSQFGTKSRGTWGWYRYSQCNVLSRIDKAIKKGVDMTVGKNKIDPRTVHPDDFWTWLDKWVAQ